MTTKIEELKAKRDQLNARIQKAEARANAAEKRADDRIKILVGAAVLNAVKGGQAMPAQELLALMQGFLVRPSELNAVLGEDGLGSEAFNRLAGIEP